LKSVAEPCSLAHTRICKFAFTSLKQVRELLELRGSPGKMTSVSACTKFSLGTIVNGPGQANVDFALSKTMGLAWPREGAALLFRGELFNVLNHPQFANPDAQFGSPTFGIISSTAVNARVGQLAIKLSF
jgi:hypothetical protein